MGPGGSSRSADVDLELGAAPLAGDLGRTAPAAVVHRWAAPVGAALIVFLLAIDQGGFFPTAWGWGALASLWVVGLWLVIGAATEIRRFDVLMIGAFAALAGWTALSILWSDAGAPPVLETERALLYATAITALLLLAWKRWLQRVAASVLAAVVLVALYSLGTRLFPDRLGSFNPIATYRLSAPVGYWNGLGIFVAMGALLALGFAARARGTAARAAAAASLPILVPTLYFTFSRGAWIALGVGLACALAFDSRRLQLASCALLLAPVLVLATWLGARSDALTHAHAPFGQTVHEGHRLALWLILLLAATASCVLIQVGLERRVHVGRTVRLAYGAALLAVPLAALVIVFTVYGGRASLATRAYDSFKAPPAKIGSNLNKRLFDLSSNGRVGLWHVAWTDYSDHPLLGSGAGTFARHWVRDRPAPAFNALDAHNLYIEKLAELGPLGLALLLAGLVLPLVAAVRARREPIAALLFGAYVAFLVHAGVDWDFELPGVSLAGIFCGVALIVAARDQPRQRAPGPAMRVGGLALAVGLTAFTLIGLIGNSALAASDSARRDHDWTRAVQQARKAHRLMPWSPDPWAALGEAQYSGGDVAAGRASLRRAAAKDPGDWRLWFDLAAVTKGAESKRAFAHARRLNPLGSELRKLAAQRRARSSP